MKVPSSSSLLGPLDQGVCVREGESERARGGERVRGLTENEGTNPKPQNPPRISKSGSRNARPGTRERLLLLFFIITPKPRVE